MRFTTNTQYNNKIFSTSQTVYTQIKEKIFLDGECTLQIFFIVLFDFIILHLK